MSDRWKEKDQLLEQFSQTGRFPAFPPNAARVAAKGDPEMEYISTEVRLEKWYEVGQIFVVIATLALLSNVVIKLLAMSSFISSTP